MENKKNGIKIIFTMLLLCLVQWYNAQAVGTPYIPAEKVPFSFLYGGSGSEVNQSMTVPTPDGGYIMLGYTTTSGINGNFTDVSRGSSDAWVVKMDAIGKITWQKRFGGSANETEGSIANTSDGGYIMAITTASTASGDITGTNHGNFDVWIVKLTNTGDISWQQMYGGNRNEIVTAIHQTADGGYIFLATSASSATGNVTGTNHGALPTTDLWIVKLNATGGIAWQQLYGGTNNETASDIKQTAEGGYIVLSNTLSTTGGNITGVNKGGLDTWVLKLNATGGITWQQLLGGTQSDGLYGIVQTTDGGYIMAGNTYSSASGNVTGTNHGDFDLWIVKLNATGGITWQQLYGGSALETCNGNIIQQTPEGGYIIVGTTQSSASGNVTGTKLGFSDFWVLKLTATGTITWQKLYGGADGSENAWSIAVAPGGYIVSGSTSASATGSVFDSTNGGVGDFWVFKIDTLGNIVWVDDTWQ
jgi:hypothetical protein